MLYTFYARRGFMAEFCKECWKKMNNFNDDSIRYVLSIDLDLCEGCGEYKRVVIDERPSNLLYYLFEKLKKLIKLKP